MSCLAFSDVTGKSGGAPGVESVKADIVLGDGDFRGYSDRGAELPVTDEASHVSPSGPSDIAAETLIRTMGIGDQGSALSDQAQNSALETFFGAQVLCHV